MRRYVQLLVILRFILKVEQCLPSKCSSTTCYILPPSPPMYQPAPSYPLPPPMYAMPPAIMPPPPPPPPPPAPMPMQMPMPMPPPQSHQIPMMIPAQPPHFPAPIDPQSVSSSAHAYDMIANQEPVRWDRQEPEYKHIEEVELVMAPAQAPEQTEVAVADVVEEKSTDSEKVEKLHENERAARMDLKVEEPEATPFDNDTITFHAWFYR